jgi:hypothetical protein
LLPITIVVGAVGMEGIVAQRIEIVELRPLNPYEFLASI